MRHRLKIALLTLALCGGVAPWAGPAMAAPAAASEGVSPADAKAIRAVVQAQLDAFAADDAKRAFALAAPKIREMFGDADTFIGMVRSGYPVVYRPASIDFMVPRRMDGDSSGDTSGRATGNASGEIVQGVRMTDASGMLWLATYILQRQPDKSWRIAGCEVAQIEGHVT